MDAINGVRRKDTTKGPPLRILSLDGGGVRGYSMLIILQELMHRTFVEIEGRAPKRHEIPKPCDHFDLIAGTGTGGLIAIMLGRLRLDIETCKDVYVRMTRRVFETDKTIAGIPYRSTLFKASKLEEAIRECVREHTIYDDEGNDSKDAVSSSSRQSLQVARPARSVSVASRHSIIGMTPVDPRTSVGVSRWGDPNALLYDSRENRTKTAVTAVYRGTPKGGKPALLRSYDSRKEPSPEYNCYIWQAGRATSATALAFKPIQIGQSTFLDEGAGKYNPSPQILDEAVCNEWPGRDVGVFLSIGTGKRPPGTNNRQHEWWEDFIGGSMGDFAEARRRLIAKIEGCEETHQYMIDEYLSKRQVNRQNYYRLNVEVGVGEYGMNEWNRLGDISTSTRMYLARPDVQAQNFDAAAKLAKVFFSKNRHERHPSWDGQEIINTSFSRQNAPLPEIPPPSNPLAVELPADDVFPPQLYQQRPPTSQPPLRQSSISDMKYTVVPDDQWPQSEPVRTPTSATRPSPPPGAYRPSMDSMHRSSGSLSQHRPESQDSSTAAYAPPLPPKTPLPYPDNVAPLSPTVGSPIGSPTYGNPMRHSSHNGGSFNVAPLRQALPPYPDTDGPPPIVNIARKPEYTGGPRY
ncbi:FabD/lysophospholipase-like protein, partial [Aureobasidium melanogenum]